MILVAITNRASYPRCKTLIGNLGDLARVLLMNPEPEIVAELGDKVACVSKARIYGDGQAMAATTGRLMADVALALGSLRPRAVVVVADRHEVLAVAAAARMMNIPVVHLLAGEHSGSVDDNIRFAISNMADLLLASHDIAAEELRGRGFTQPIRVTGCPSIDLCDPLYADIAGIMGYGYGGLVDGPFYLACQHPDTDLTLEGNIKWLGYIAGMIGDRSAVWVRPTEHDAWGREMDKWLSQHARPSWRLVRHIPHRLMLSLSNACIAMIGNSSMMYREAAYMGVPCMPIGDRQKGRVTTRNIVAALPAYRDRLDSDPIWQEGGGEKAAKAIMSRYQ
ncbi:MAG: UDP-N-acetylglucosamine 2-epimerase [Gammaproteobacteria bacterium]